MDARGAPSFIPRRLDKFVRQASALSLTAIRAAWAAGRIRVSADAPGLAKPALELNHLIYEGDTVELDGKRLFPSAQHYTAKLNKPKAVTSTARDPSGQSDLRPWLSRMPEGTFAVGRLDRDTTGLLLFSTDGELADAVLQPERHLDKKYWLWIDEELTTDDPRLLAMTRPGKGYDCAKHVEVLLRTPSYAEVELTLDRGKHHQIRKLCYALRLRLVHLHRRSVGPIGLDSLPIGDFCPLSEAEVSALWAAAGGRERIHQAQAAALARHAQKARERGQSDTRLEAWLERHVAPGSDGSTL